MKTKIVASALFMASIVACSSAETSAPPSGGGGDPAPTGTSEISTASVFATVALPSTIPTNHAGNALGITAWRTRQTGTGAVIEALGVDGATMMEVALDDVPVPAGRRVKTTIRLGTKTAQITAETGEADFHVTDSDGIDETVKPYLEALDADLYAVRSSQVRAAMLLDRKENVLQVKNTECTIASIGLASDVVATLVACATAVINPGAVIGCALGVPGISLGAYGTYLACRSDAHKEVLSECHAGWPCACLYDNVTSGGRFSGPALCLSASQDVRELGQWNDRTSAIELMFGVKVQVFSDHNFSGENWWMDRSQPWVGKHWNDKISSIRVWRP